MKRFLPAGAVIALLHAAECVSAPSTALQRMPLKLLTVGEDHTLHHLLGVAIVLCALVLGYRFGIRYQRRKWLESDAPSGQDKAPTHDETTASEGTPEEPREETVSVEQEAAENSTETPAAQPHKEVVVDPAFIAEARAVVARHLDDADWTIEAFAHEMHLSQQVFSNRLRDQTGQLPNELIRQMRMEEACRLIREGSYDISTICGMVGYADPKYFTRVFKKQYGIPPSKYREQLQDESGIGA